MYIIGRNEPIYNSDLSLSEMLSRFLLENDITDSAISNEIGVTRATLSKFLQGKADLKFMQAVRLMKILGIPVLLAVRYHAIALRCAAGSLQNNGICLSCLQLYAVVTHRCAGNKISA